MNMWIARDAYVDNSDIRNLPPESDEIRRKRAERVARAIEFSLRRYNKIMEMHNAITPTKGRDIEATIEFYDGEILKTIIEGTWGSEYVGPEFCSLASDGSDGNEILHQALSRTFIHVDGVARQTKDIRRVKWEWVKTAK